MLEELKAPRLYEYTMTPATETMSIRIRLAMTSLTPFLLWNRALCTFFNLLLRLRIQKRKGIGTLLGFN